MTCTVAKALRRSYRTGSRPAFAETSILQHLKQNKPQAVLLKVCEELLRPSQLQRPALAAHERCLPLGTMCHSHCTRWPAVRRRMIYACVRLRPRFQPRAPIPTTAHVLHRTSISLALEAERCNSSTAIRGEPLNFLYVAPRRRLFPNLSLALEGPDCLSGNTLRIVFSPLLRHSAVAPLNLAICSHQLLD